MSNHLYTNDALIYIQMMETEGVIHYIHTELISHSTRM